jgi:hypothetical protein
MVEVFPVNAPALLPMKASCTRNPMRLNAISPVRRAADLSLSDWMIDIIIIVFKMEGKNR